MYIMHACICIYLYNSIIHMLFIRVHSEIKLHFIIRKQITVRGYSVLFKARQRHDHNLRLGWAANVLHIYIHIV